MDFCFEALKKCTQEAVTTHNKEKHIHEYQKKLSNLPYVVYTRITSLFCGACDFRYAHEMRGEA
jgi:C4-type Zn-finger protein